MSSPIATSPLSSCTGSLASTSYVNDVVAAVRQLTQATAAFEQRLADTEVRLAELDQRVAANQAPVPGN